jgi:hypothetical protein
VVVFFPEKQLLVVCLGHEDTLSATHVFARWVPNGGELRWDLLQKPVAPPARPVANAACKHANARDKSQSFTPRIEFTSLSGREPGVAWDEEAASR